MGDHGKVEYVGGGDHGKVEYVGGGARCRHKWW